MTTREVERFTEITGIGPERVKSLDELTTYLARYYRLYAGWHRAARFLRWLIDRERLRCLGQST